MECGGIIFCDICKGAIHPDEIAPLHLKGDDGHVYRFHLHNRKKSDCIVIFLDLLQAEYLGNKTATV